MYASYTRLFLLSIAFAGDREKKAKKSAARQKAAEKVGRMVF